MFDKLTNKQCAILLAVIAGVFGPVILLVLLNVAEMLIGSMQMGLFSFCVLGYATYKLVRMIDPDNDSEDEEVLW